jgi:hypothetical protein
MKELILENEVVLLDDEDYEFITECYNLHIDRNGYVQCRVKKKFKNIGLFTSLSLHKLLINPYKTGRGINVDHIDGNKLNNQKVNLRICLHKENMRNRKLQGGSSKYKGVYWNNKLDCWSVQIKVDTKNIYIGCFTNEIASANCYNHWAKQYFGEFALLNDVLYMSPEEYNKYKKGTNKTSKYRGVIFDKREGRFKAQIWDNISKKNLQLGYFDLEEDAARTYDNKAKELKGEKARLNFK